ncbi:hypothetical protein CLAFUW4_12297 [Fulvia fulva]|uniref:Uncharacterized protein n=1 Tax=Passalora fulva TaxID=5499 RepID=A0A9Q8PFE5_PASFU|nr:uncharacterized protein CLAFUR5_11327 [Fulvia fulva]KAK4618216.1 hypothetical protein CLAFUR4_12302 [Fulvia fulva]KAK4619015.1 hypothetical protein CLAFUR0_12313 [Fulvia fulva]UJO21407.1 hypothetical protein CLAFUR5_11327 [Fulvia fulva]WPV17960.1 hypothetical protein CLAFUW4_12297 [Fulvia fulva]WPV32876.1 hypothetical protein CLAFUW7_12304 [Fulvia fulva]
MLHLSYLALVGSALMTTTLAHSTERNSHWKTLNNPVVHDVNSTTFTITTPPATDIWRPNVTADSFTAPYVYKVCKTADFQRISVTIDAYWKTQYDQGGIAVVLPSSSKHHGSHKNGRESNKWIKTGIEYYLGAPQFGTVATYAFSDWSLSPVRPEGSTAGSFLLERNTNEAWVYTKTEEGQYPLRKVTWAFLEGRSDEDAEVWVGVYAAKPTYTEGDLNEGLEVTFRDLVVEC